MDKVKAVDEEVAKLLEKKAIAKHQKDWAELILYSLVFLVKEQNGDWRPIIDLSRLHLFYLRKFIY